MSMSTTTTTVNASHVAAEMLGRLETAWNRGDGDAFGALYTPEASFVNIRGDRIVGSDAIGAGHAGIFATIYAGSVNRMRLLSADEIADGAVLAVSENTLDCPSGPLAGVHRAMSTSVLVREHASGAWRIVATHNTLESN